MANLTWNGGFGDWFDPTKWSPSQVPQEGDTATITSGSVQLTSNPADGVTLYLAAVSSPNTILTVQDVTFGRQFTIVSVGLNNIQISGSVVNQGSILDNKAIGILGQNSTDVFVNEGLINVSQANPALPASNFTSTVDLINSGEIDVSYGMFVETKNLTGTGAINISNNGGFEAQGAVASGQTFTFLDGTNDSITRINPSNFAGSIVNFQRGNQLGLSLTVDSENYDPVTHLLSLSSQGQLAGSLLITGPLSYTTQSFTLSSGGIGTVITTDAVPCFCRGTLILSERGQIAVEDLSVGDRVQTLSGALKPIVWIGYGHALVTRGNRMARPIVVRRGALADDLPFRDLYLTHGHALYFDNVLIPVEHLVNHNSIAWDHKSRIVEYYHIELPDHDVLLANGAAAESYYDAKNRALFQNAREGSKPGIAKPTCAPVMHDGEIVETIWAKLFERAGGRIERDTTGDPDVHLIVEGNRLDSVVSDNGVHSFEIEIPPAKMLRLCSRAGVPSLLGLGRRDHRLLGIAIERIDLHHAGVTTSFHYHLPQLGEGGCHCPESGYRWTDGELELPLRFFTILNGPFVLVVYTKPHHDMRYPLSYRLSQAA
jgi:hypothetical protein